MKRKIKTMPTDRARGPNLLVERRTNAWAGRVGYFTGRGHSAEVVARFLNDGTSPETVRRMWKLWGLQDVGHNRNNIYVPVKLTVYERKVLQRLAEARGIDLAEWLRRIGLSCGIPEDLYQAVTDGAFDKA